MVESRPVMPQVAWSGDSDVGGLVGFSGRTITSSYATGDVSGASNVGGLVGTEDACTWHHHSPVITAVLRLFCRAALLFLPMPMRVR